MRLAALEHLAQIALEMIGPDSRLIVVGSSSLLGSIPEFGEEPGPLETSFDADVVPEPFSEDIGIMLHEALGEDRRFHQLHGYCLDVLRPDIAEQFPPGWEGRLVPLLGIPRVRCLEPHDLAAAKCRTGREKDIVLLSLLARQNLIDLDTVEERLRASSMIEAQIVRAFGSLKQIRERIQET